MQEQHCTSVEVVFLLACPVRRHSQTDKQTDTWTDKCTQMNQAVHTIAAAGSYLFTLVQHAGK